MRKTIKLMAMATFALAASVLGAYAQTTTNITTDAIGAATAEFMEAASAQFYKVEAAP